eukprot:TRINITY_DN7175_c0_g1_i1.p1 TRINITY_DN7175_c0_g1~~TRINITY_DN7175_c0_g1_i1.p1  ORF type:complete len:667 (-),score=199.63 TRINITY_DN7175_c0_g1_i1:7-2007(-)
MEDDTGEKAKKRKAQEDNNNAEDKENRFDKMLSSMRKTVHDHVKIEQKKQGYNHSDVLKRLIALKTDDQAGRSEINIRLGLVLGEAFREGIRKPDFELVLSKLSSFLKIPSETIVVQKYSDYTYQHGDGRIHILYDEKQKQCLKAFLRKHISGESKRFPFGPYDVSIGLAKEVEYDTPSTLLEEWLNKREVTKYTCRFREWKILMTQSTTFGTRKDATLEVPKFDFECEFDHEAILVMQKLAEDKIVEKSEQFFEWLKDFEITIQNSTDKYFFDDIKMKKVDDMEEKKELVRQILEWFPTPAEPLDPNVKPPFPGSKPIHFSRKYLQMVQKEKYYASEKTDGIRYLMYITQMAVYLVDSKMRFHEIFMCDFLIDLYFTKGPTLADGVMVRHQGTNRPNFVVFDLLVMNGVRICETTLTERLKQIGVSLMLPFRKAQDENRIPGSLPFHLTGQKIMDKSQIGKIFELVKADELGYKFKDDKRDHRTDGIILTPDTSYNPESSKIFKWQYLDTLTLVLKINAKSDQRAVDKYYFTCIGPDATEVEYSIQLNNLDREKLSRDMARHKDTTNLSAEFSYDHWTGYWRYKILRTKGKHNGIKEIFETLELISENISKEELTFRLPLPSGEDQKWFDIQKQCYKNVLGDSHHGASHSGHGHGPPASHPPHVL